MVSVSQPLPLDDVMAEMFVCLSVSLSLSDVHHVYMHNIHTMSLNSDLYHLFQLASHH